MLLRVAARRAGRVPVRELHASRTSAAAVDARKYFAPVEVRDGVAIIRLDGPEKVNTVSNEMRDAAEALWNNEVANRSDVKAAVFISSKPDNFIAGADINMLRDYKEAGREDELKGICMTGHDMFDKLSSSGLPLVAAINGSCLGGGLEWAMKCDYRVASTSKKTKLGLPEVKLGLLPGWGGTQNLPKLVGLMEALPLILAGKELRSDKAKKIGLVDQVCDVAALESVAVDAARGLADGTLKKKQVKKSWTRWASEDVSFARNYVLKKAKEGVAKQAGSADKYPGPYAILDCVAKGFESPATHRANLEYEASRFVELAKSPTSSALIGLFDGMTALKKNRYADATPAGAPKPSTVAVLGAGLMGAGIAQVSCEKGFRVILKDANKEGLGKGEDYITGNLDTKVKRRRMAAYDRNVAVSNVVPLHDGPECADALARHLGGADVVIEAVPEDLGLKHRVIAGVEPLMRADAVFATNTSAIPIADVAAGSSRPGRVIGMHYFSPVPQMPLLEIIPHAGTDRDACARAVDVGVKQGKTCIVVKDVPGFYVNRCLAPMLAEVFPLFQDGVTPEQLDKAMKSLGMPVGPVTLIDEVGFDVAAHVTETMVADATMGVRMAGADPAKQNRFVEMGWLGKKSGKGFFEYDKKGKRGGFNQEALGLIKSEVMERDAKLTPEQIQDRMLARFINETALCLQEGIIESPVDGDMGAVFGIGFLPFMGGPFRMLDIVGVEGYVAKMNGLAEQYGEHFAPCQLLQDHARAGTKFHAGAKTLEEQLAA